MLVDMQATKTQQSMLGKKRLAHPVCVKTQGLFLSRPEVLHLPPLMSANLSSFPSDFLIFHLSSSFPLFSFPLHAFISNPVCVAS